MLCAFPRQWKLYRSSREGRGRPIIFWAMLTTLWSAFLSATVQLEKQTHMQCVQAEGKLSDSLLIAKGVPQGSVLGPLLFTIYINCLDYDNHANFHFYADDSVMSCRASSGKQALYTLQSAFDAIQSRIYNLKLVLNVDKNKYMLFSGSKYVSSLQTLQGIVIESVKEYKYLGIIVDDVLSFSSHITQLKKK